MYVNLTWFNLEFLSFIYKTLKRQNLYSQNLTFLSIYFFFSIKPVMLKIMNSAEKIKEKELSGFRLVLSVVKLILHFAVVNPIISILQR